MNTSDRINQRLEKLGEFVNILKSLKGVTTQELENDIEKRAVAERFLQLTIEACIDISEMIIADRRLATPKTAAEAIEILGREGILEPEFAKNFAKAAGLRNILIHDYIEIDYAQVADKINNKLGDFNTFAKTIAGFITHSG